MRKFLVIILASVLVLSLTTKMYTELSLVLTVVIFVSMLDKFGKGVVLLETMAFYSCIIYLVMPLMGYSLYNQDSRITTIWKRTMPIPFETYYSFILPGICAYVLGLFLISYLSGRKDEGKSIDAVIIRIKQILSRPGKAGVGLIIAGLCFFFIKPMVPGSLAAVAGFGYMLIFPGLLFVHFQPRFKGKIWLYILVGIFFLRDALNTGMFTVSFYMSITIVSFFLLGRKVKFPVKLIAVAGAISALFVLQLVKGSFRKSTNRGKYEGSKLELFQNMVLEEAGNFSNIFSPNAFFPIYMRLNQGWTTALVLRRIPAIQPYDQGASIATTLAASVVPRILWPDKPESGGVYNMKHFAGYTIKGWSVNVGPVGEAYGNFGPGGGIAYLFLFGLFLGWAYEIVFRFAVKSPLFILWIPLLFFEVTYSMENDTLQALNSLMKATVFLWMLNKVFPYLFGNGIKKQVVQKNENSAYHRNNGSGWSIPG